jgi:hypothetical protein
MARTRAQDLPAGKELDIINDQAVADFLGVPGVIQLTPVAGNGGGDSTPRRKRRRWGSDDGALVAGRATASGTTLVINRPSDVWPWLGRRKEKSQRGKGTALLVVASLLVLVLAAGQGYVSWFAQFHFVLAAKHAVVPSAIEGTGLDAAAVIFAFLAIVLARLGRRAIVPRILNVSCAAGSLLMNVLAGDLTSPRSLAIFALPSVLYATASDQLIAVIRRHALPPKDDAEEQRSAWAMAWRAVVRVACLIALVIAWILRLPLYVIRMTVAPSDTFGGLKQLVIVLTPLPEVEVLALETGGGKDTEPDKKKRRRRGGRKGAPTKKSVLLALYADHASFGDRKQVSAIAREIAARADLGEGTARTYLYELIDKTPAGDLNRVRRELLEGAQA